MQPIHNILGLGILLPLTWLQLVFGDDQLYCITITCHSDNGEYRYPTKFVHSAGKFYGYVWTWADGIRHADEKCYFVGDLVISGDANNVVDVYEWDISDVHTKVECKSCTITLIDRDTEHCVTHE